MTYAIFSTYTIIIMITHSVNILFTEISFSDRPEIFLVSCGLGAALTGSRCLDCPRLLTSEESGWENEVIQPIGREL